MQWIADHLWLFWVLWLAVFGVGYFSLFETIAFLYHGETFSAFMVRISYAWPPYIFLWGLLVGALMTHLLWTWTPPAAIGSTGG